MVHKWLTFGVMFLLVFTLSSQFVHAEVKEIETKCKFNSRIMKDDCYTIIDFSSVLGDITPYKIDMKSFLEEKEIVSKTNVLGNSINFKTVVWDKNRVMISGTVELASSTYWGIRGVWNSTWWNSTFPIQIRFDVNSSVSSDLYNYTALIPFDAYSWEANGTLASNCSDLLFVDGTDNTSLSWEIDNDCLDNSFWVRLPILETDNTTFGYIYIGNSTGILYEDPINAWDNDYVFVNHMNDNTTSTVTDTFGQTGNKEASNQPMITTGTVEYGQDFGATDEIDYGDLAVDGSSALTVSAWLKRDGDSHSGGSGGVVTKDQRGNASDSSFSLFVLNTDDKPQFRVWGTGDAQGGCSATVNDGTWNYLAGTYDSGTHTVTIYKDGSSCGTDDTMTGNVVNAGASLWIGDTYSADGNVLDGKVDEVRIAFDNFTSDWIKYDYDIVKYNTQLVWFGGAEALGEEPEEPEPDLNITVDYVEDYFCYTNNGTNYSVFNHTVNGSSTLYFSVCDYGCNDDNFIISILDNDPNLCNANPLGQMLIFIAFLWLLYSAYKQFK